MFPNLRSATRMLFEICRSKDAEKALGNLAELGRDDFDRRDNDTSSSLEILPSCSFSLKCNAVVGVVDGTMSGVDVVLAFLSRVVSLVDSFVASGAVVAGFKVVASLGGAQLCLPPTYTGAMAKTLERFVFFFCTVALLVVLFSMVSASDNVSESSSNKSCNQPTASSALGRASTSLAQHWVVHSINDGGTTVVWSCGAWHTLVATSFILTEKPVIGGLDKNVSLPSLPGIFRQITSHATTPKLNRSAAKPYSMPNITSGAMNSSVPQTVMATCAVDVPFPFPSIERANPKSQSTTFKWRSNTMFCVLISRCIILRECKCSMARAASNIIRTRRYQVNGTCSNINNCLKSPPSW